MQSLPTRSEVNPHYTWDLSSIFPTVEAWEAAFQEVSLAFAGLQRFKGHLGDDPATLVEYLSLAQLLRQKLGLVGQYARLNYAVDTTNQESAALNGRAGGLMAQAMAAIAFEEPEFMSIGFVKLRSWMKENAELAVFGHYFDQLERRAAHVRSAEVEELFSQVSDTFITASATHGILANADLNFKPARSGKGSKPVEVTHSKKQQLFSSPDRKLRRSAWLKYADGHLAYQNTMANCLAAGVKQDVFQARARGYGSSLEAALESSYIPVSVFHNVLSAFKENLPVWHRYWDVRCRALGLKKLHVYDTYATLGGSAVEIPYEQAVDWISEGLLPMGEEYIGILRKGALKDRWVDSALNKGKRFGAFSSGMKGTHPFIMMSYDGSIFGLSTLAHELGHSMHSYFTSANQPFFYCRYSLFVAEVASNFHQAMVRATLLNTKKEPDFQLAVLQEAFNNFYRYFFTMPVLAAFDLEIHQRAENNQALTAEVMNNIMADLLQEGYGPNVVVDRRRDGCLWAQFSTHLYNKFYAYQYTTGIAGAHTLAEGVLSGSAKAQQNYLAFLKAGDSLYPVDALQLAGVDLTTPEPIHKTFKVLEHYIDRLEELLLG